MVDVPQPTESDNKHIEPEPSESDEGSEDQSPQGWDENNWGDMDVSAAQYNSAILKHSLLPDKS